MSCINRTRFKTAKSLTKTLRREFRGTSFHVHHEDVIDADRKGVVFVTGYRVWWRNGPAMAAVRRVTGGGRDMHLVRA